MLKVTSQEIINDFEKGPIRRSLFSNGATSLFHKAVGFSGAKINLNFIAGSMFESKNEHGLAHVIEHMVFKETDSFIVKKLELLGADINAYTFKENVCFELECLASKVEQFLPLFLELFCKLDFTEQQFSKEKKVILQELKEDFDDHETYGLEYIFNKNFKVNLGHPIGGAARDVKSFKAQDVRNYHSKFYTPSRLVLTVVSGEEFDSLEEILFEKMQCCFIYKESRPFRLKAISRISKINHFKRKIKRSMESSILMLSYTAPSLNHKNYYDLAILDQVLFEGLSSVLFRELREVKPLVYGLGSSINSFKDTGNYVMVFNTSKVNILEIKKKVKSILNEYLVELIDDTEIEMIKDRIVDAWEVSFDSIDERANFITDNEIYQLNELSMNTVKENIAKTSAKSIRALLKKLLSHGQSELVIESK